MVEDIHHENDVKQKILQNYLFQVIEYTQAQINALLERITEHASLIERYGPTVENYQKQNWLSAAFLIAANKELDFVQILNEKELTASILLPDSEYRIARKVPYGGPVPLLIMENPMLQANIGPYVGVEFNLQKEYHSEGILSNDSSIVPTAEVEYYILFDIPTMMNMDIANKQKQIDLIEDQVMRLQFDITTLQQMKNLLHHIVDSLAKAQKFFQSRPEFYQQVTSADRMNWLLKMMPNLAAVKMADSSAESASPFREAENRSHEIEMVGQLGMFIATGVFGQSPFDSTAPVGIAHILKGEDHGQMLYKHDVFLSKPLELHGEERGVHQGKENSQTSLQYFFEDGFERFFFGNTAELVVKYNSEGQIQKRKGSLTLGVDATRILKNLAMVSHRMAFFATPGKIIKGFDINGEDLSPYFSLIPLSTILSQKTGVVYAPDGSGYFFINLHPFPQMDFYFFLLNPVEKEFALVNAIDKNATALLSKIKYQTQIVIVISLLIIILMAHFLAKRITKPILLLLGATKEVKEGKLNDVHLPPIPNKKMDEIETLYFSFSQMVEGLKEKEKVKGILDKVVSPIIAKEILQGQVHLGGEEKVVTVLFADIREFSKISEKMLPHEVITMLNQCMTKISHIIDAHGGVIDKYVGDEVMALFGAPVETQDSASQAVICAIEIQLALEKWNLERKRQGLPPIEMGIGIHTGVVVAGNMGAENRLNYTVLGANVNLAARICSSAKEREIIISEDTLAQPYVKDHIEYEALAHIELKGFTQSIPLFRIGPKRSYRI